MTARIIGGHPPDAGGLAMAVRRGAAAGMEAIQLFTAPPVYYNEKVGAKPERITALHEALAAAAIEPRNVLVHAAYVLNTASEDPAKAERARRGLAQELKRSTAYGVGGCCFHPGSAGKGDSGSACEQVGDAIAYALEQAPGTDSRTRVLIENTAGAGRTVGRSPGEVARMLSRVPASLRARAGYGLDTCHLFASGYDIRSSPAAMRAVLDEFEQVLGERAAFFHLNDSQHPLGSNKDRHAWIGEGVLGVEPFRWLLADDRTAGVPLILETPQERAEVRGDDPSPDPADVRMVQLMRSLL